MNNRPRILPLLALHALAVACYCAFFVMLFAGIRDAPWRLYVASAALLVGAVVQLYLLRDVWKMLLRGDGRLEVVKPPAETQDGRSISN